MVTAVLSKWGMTNRLVVVSSEKTLSLIEEKFSVNPACSKPLDVFSENK